MIEFSTPIKKKDKPRKGHYSKLVSLTRVGAVPFILPVGTVFSTIAPIPLPYSDPIIVSAIYVAWSNLEEDSMIFT